MNLKDIKLKLGKKVFIAFTIVLLVIGVIGVINYDRLVAVTEKNASETALAKIQHIDDELHTMNTLYLQTVRGSMRTLIHAGLTLGTPNTGESIHFAGMSVPNLLLGDNSVVGKVNLVDHIKDLTGATATIFVKSGSDFVRVSTNVMKEDGSRAVGTVLDPNGKAMAAIKQGKPFYGVVDILGKPYITGYEPIYNAKRHIVGVWYIGYPVSTMTELGNVIKKSRILDNGFVALVDNKGDVIFKSDNADDFSNDAITQIATQTITEKDGWKFVNHQFDEWGYTIVAAINSDDVKTLTSNLVWSILGLVGIVMLLVLVAAYIAIIKFVVKPVNGLIEAANRIAADDLSGDIPVIRTGDELEELSVSFNKMQQNLRGFAEVAKNISVGNLELGLKMCNASETTGDLSSAFSTMIGNLNAVTKEIGGLTKAALEGNLDARGDVTRHGGDFAAIVEGVNRTLDAVIEPIKEASMVLRDMAEGNLQVNVEGNYRGDHAEIKDALNHTINRIRNYIEEVSRTLTEMSKGNLDVGITSEFKGDFREIKDSIELIIKSFNQILGEINNSAEQVASAAGQVSGASQGLSQGSTEQAASVQQISASMEQIASQTRDNAVNATRANELTMAAKDDAMQGNIQMNEMLKSMEAINQSSASISKIIKVIDEIAFQTNILALNAAVEAARAGQHGKGFAVVAEEVRNLAARSASAAKETTGMIEGSVKKVELGTKIANETAEALNKIVERVAQAAALVGDIANASNQQASGIAQINQGMLQVAQVTQMNTATAEESAAASEELSSQSELLRNMVAKFKLKKVDEQAESLEDISPELLRKIKDALQKESAETEPKVPKLNAKNNTRQRERRVKINLDDMNFGKY